MDGWATADVFYDCCYTPVVGLIIPFAIHSIQKWDWSEDLRQVFFNEGMFEVYHF